MGNPSVIIDFEPDWRSGLELTYEFQTIIQSNRYFVEQRRPLVSTPIRSLKCSFVLSDWELQRLRNVLMYGSSRFCGVPIFSEPVLLSGVGASSVTASTDITYFWNLNNSTYGILLDTITSQSEMVVITNVSGSTITFQSALTKSWTASQTVFYPAFGGYLVGLSKKDKTSRVGIIEVEFGEIDQASASAEPVWEGAACLENLVCPQGVVAASWNRTSIDFTTFTLTNPNYYPNRTIYTATETEIYLKTDKGYSVGVNASKNFGTSMLDIGDYLEFDFLVEKFENYSDSGNDSGVDMFNLFRFYDSSVTFSHALFLDAGLTAGIYMFTYDEGNPSSDNYVIPWKKMPITRYVRMLRTANNSMQIDLFSSASRSKREGRLVSKTNSVSAYDLTNLAVMSDYNAQYCGLKIKIRNLVFFNQGA